MPLLVISLAISMFFSTILVKFDNSTKVKHPITNRRHTGKNGLLDINKNFVE